MWVFDIGIYEKARDRQYSITENALKIPAGLFQIPN